MNVIITELVGTGKLWKVGIKTHCCLFTDLPHTSELDTAFHRLALSFVATQIRKLSVTLVIGSRRHVVISHADVQLNKLQPTARMETST